MIPQPINRKSLLSISIHRFDGTISSIDDEGFKVGKQIHIKPTFASDYMIRIFHTYPVGIRRNSKVSAGQKIGYIGDHQGTDISIETNANFKNRNFSYFEVMSEDVFKGYIARGTTSRNDFIISKEYREAQPLSCNGDQFVNKRDNPDDWVNLK